MELAFLWQFSYRYIFVSFFSALYVIHVGYSDQGKLYLLIWCSNHHARWSEDTQLIHYWGERFEQTYYSKIPKRENTACKHPFQVEDGMNIFHKFNRRSDMYRKWHKLLLFVKVVKGFKHIWVKLSPCNHELIRRIRKWRPLSLFLSTNPEVVYRKVLTVSFKILMPSDTSIYLQ